MCFKKWFGKPDAITPVPTGYQKYALLFGINDYQGSGNDLNGCINDIEDVSADLKKRFPGFLIRIFKDSEVTTSRLISEIESVIEIAKQTYEKIFLYIHYSGHGTQVPDNTGKEKNGYHEALYLHNGPLIDDVIYNIQQRTPDNLTVLVKLDCCFSGNFGERKMNPRNVKNRFMPLPGVKISQKPVNRFALTDLFQKWVFISGCGEEQTSADAYFTRYNGAFTYYDLKSFSNKSTYVSEVPVVRSFLRANDFDQVPEISGPEERQNKIVFTV